MRSLIRRLCLRCHHRFNFENEEPREEGKRVVLAEIYPKQSQKESLEGGACKLCTMWRDKGISAALVDNDPSTIPVTVLILD
jgi:hypothetical protein